MTIDDLLAAAEVIKNETGISKNTHIRVGAILENMINYFANNVAPVTSELIKDAIAKSTSGIRKGMTVGWDLDLGPIPAGFALANGNGGAKINGVTIQDRRGSFSIGYDPAKFLMPYDDAVEAKGIENYGKVGNVGGLNSLKLSVDQLPPHSFKTVANAHDSNHAAEDHADEFLQMDSDNRAGNNDYKLQVGKTKPTLCGTDIVGKGLEIDKRPRYITVCYITKYSDDIDGGGSGITAEEAKTISRTLIAASSASTATITLDVVNQVQSDTNNGTTDVALALSNLPAVSCESFLTVKNVRAAAFNLVLPTSPFTNSGITYSFTLMVATPLSIAAAKSAELHFIFVFIDETHCNIRIAGGVEV